MARIPEETIERIRNTADIYDVVAQYVDLKKRGRNYFGLCPFHSEKHLLSVWRQINRSTIVLAADPAGTFSVSLWNMKK